jgi:hypothetical protein
MPNNPRDDLIDILEAVSKAQLHALHRLRQPGQQKAAAAGVGKTKRMSHIDIVFDILRNAARPLHISEILSLVAQRHGIALDRESVVSALAKRVARKDRFVRTGPNTFSLLPETAR